MGGSASSACLSEAGEPMESAFAGDRSGHRDQRVLVISLGLDCRPLPGARHVVCNCGIGAADSDCLAARCWAPPAPLDAYGFDRSLLQIRSKPPSKGVSKKGVSKGSLCQYIQ